MRRRKMRFAWIENETSRKTSFKKRRTGLVKKVRELSTLCGASAFIVIHGPGESEPPTVWPSVAEARVLYDQFRSVPDFERCQKMLNQESYLKERATKMAAQLRKHKDKMTAYVMRQVIGRGKPLSQFGTSELSSVVSVLEEKMKETKKKIVEYHHHHHHHQTVGIQPPGSSFLLSSPVIPMEEVLVGTPGDHSVSWESLFGGIMNTSTSTNTNTNTNNNMNVRSSGVDDQGNSMGMQVPDHQLFLGGTTSLGATYNYNNNVQPYFVAGRSSSSSTGNDQVGIQPYGSHFGHGGRGGAT